MVDVELYLVRHGESVRNTQPDLIGQAADEKLSNNGVSQARMLGRHFGIKSITFDKVFYSPYKRAADTWRIASDKFDNPDQLGVLVHELREYSAGDMTDRSRKEIYGNTMMMNDMNELGMLFKFDNGESLFEVQQRAVTWLNKILSIQSKDVSIALFTHGMVIKCLLQHFMHFDQHMTWRVKVDNTSITHLSRKNGLWSINCINSTPHLND